MRFALPTGRGRTGVLLAAALLATGGAVTATSSAASAAACADVDVVVARGTSEPGRLGIIVGDPVYSAIQRRLIGATSSSHAVDYPASVSPTSVTAGNRALVEHVTAQAQECPDQRFVLVGYSQGANVVGNSLGISSQGAAVGGPVVATIPAAVQPRVAAVLVFGYPLRKLGRGITGVYAERTLDICANRDVVCDPRGASTLAHLSYGDDASRAAAFAVGRL
ncbi:cutinase family protein [Actinoplanes sp. NEAU-A12]|uniref:Cutinase family protein n=1 Tax=Actinoplanes sandaracinus TaxID=3045177 RepID=A0ABT6WG96_9ACTN|nr:cutinase family protein [Actinoplanes sandaracinus]MDI6098753.1 cutinase family protein [Actinoplanes sandaracinus]